MEIEPPSLNIPLGRKEHWAPMLALVCAAVTGIAAFLSPSFATVFAASSIVGLPALLVMIFPSPISAKFSAWGNFGRIAFAAVLLGYFAIAKTVLVPLAIGVLEQFLSWQR